MIISLVSRLNIVQTCIYAFKEAVLKYRSLNSNLYSCFLDAFDRVNHYVLLEQFIKRGIPVHI